MVNPNNIPNFKDLNQFGFSVFVLPRGRKTPIISWKEFQSRKPTAQELADWDGAEVNAAVVTGRISNLVVLDIDSVEAQKLVDGWKLPETPTVKTANGRHYYFSHPDCEVRNGVNIAGVKLDVRGEGGYVVAPGSQHPNGAFYEWEVSPADCELAQLPAEIVEKLLPAASTQSLAKQGETGSFIEAGSFSCWLNRELHEKVEELREAEEGGRNDALFRVAVGLANHVAALALDWALVEDVLRPEALAIGLTRDETNRTLQSAWDIGEKTPTELLEIARNWIYVASRDRFWSPTAGRELSPRAFSMNFAEAKPFAKGTLANFLTESGLIVRVLDFAFRPSMPTGVFSERGDQFYNTYNAPNIAAESGDSSPFLEFCEYLIPEVAEREHLLKMIAWTLAHPGEKLSYALLLKSTEHGVGKSTLVDIWRQLLGYENTRLTSSDEMESGYQSYLADKLLVVLEELNLGSGITSYNRLKAMITSETATINEKYIKQRERREIMQISSFSPTWKHRSLSSKTIGGFLS